jgi:hypothetical protein
VGPYGGSGTPVAAMVHCVISINVCFVLNPYVKLKTGKFPVFVAGSMVTNNMDVGQNTCR